MNFSEFLKYALLMIVAPGSQRAMEWRMLRLLNKDRKTNGLKPVRMQEDLRAVARKHSADMAEKDYFDHVNLSRQSPSDRLKLARVTDVQSGENLAKIRGYANPTQYAEKGLMESPGHRANILTKSYNVVGIGVIQSSDKTYYFTQNFAKRSLIFDTKIPAKVRRHKGVRIKGEVVGDVSSILYHVQVPGHRKPLNEVIVAVRQGKFDFHIPFDEIGRFEIRFYIGKFAGRQYSLSNKFDIKVVRGWIGWILGR